MTSGYTEGSLCSTALRYHAPIVYPVLPDVQCCTTMYCAIPADPRFAGTSPPHNAGNKGWVPEVPIGLSQAGEIPLHSPSVLLAWKCQLYRNSPRPAGRTTGGQAPSRGTAGTPPARRYRSRSRYSAEDVPLNLVPGAVVGLASPGTALLHSASPRY